MLTLISVSPDGAKDAPMLAELNLFSMEVMLVFSPASRRTFSLAVGEISHTVTAEP